MADGERRRERSEDDPHVVVASGDPLFEAGTIAVLEGVGVPAVSLAAVQERHRGSGATVLVDVDAVDRTAWDLFGGVALVATARATFGHGTRIVGVSREASHQLLQVRLHDAGATHRLARAALTRADPASAMSGPGPGLQRLHVNLDVRREWGLEMATDLGAGLDQVRRLDLHEAVARRRPANEIGLSRRRMISLRSTLSSVMGLQPPPPLSASLTPPTVPTWRALVALLNEARGAGPPPLPSGSTTVG